MNNESIKEIRRNIENLKINHNNFLISKQLSDISKKIQVISGNLQNNIHRKIDGDDNKIETLLPAGHILPIYNNSMRIFYHSLRRGW